MRFLVATSLALLAFAGVAAWVVEAEPDWYMRARYPLEYEHIVSAHARNYGLEPALLAAVIYAESRFDADVESSAGAVGTKTLARMLANAPMIPTPASITRKAVIRPRAVTG